MKTTGSPQPLGPEAFTARGLDAATAQRFADQHNEAAGVRGTVQAPQPPSAAAAPTRLPPPVPKPTPDTPPSDAVRARAEMNDIQRRRANGEISDYAWKREFEPKLLQLAGIADSVAAYEAAGPGEKNALRHQWAEDETQGAVEQAIDAEKPASSATDYTLPHSENMDQNESEVDRAMREGLFALGAPIVLGNHIGESVTATAVELVNADSPEAQIAVVERNAQRLRERWGPQFDANLEAVKELLRNAGERQPLLRGLIHEHPELYSGVDTMNYLLQLAQRWHRAHRTN